MQTHLVPKKASKIAIFLRQLYYSQIGFIVLVPEQLPRFWHASCPALSGKPDPRKPWGRMYLHTSYAGPQPTESCRHKRGSRTQSCSALLKALSASPQECLRSDPIMEANFQYIFVEEFDQSTIFGTLISSRAAMRLGNK